MSFNGGSASASLSVELANMLRKSSLSRLSNDGNDRKDARLELRSSCVEGAVADERMLNRFDRPRVGRSSEGSRNIDAMFRSWRSAPRCDEICLEFWSALIGSSMQIQLRLFMRMLKSAEMMLIDFIGHGEVASVGEVNNSADGATIRLSLKQLGLGGYVLVQKAGISTPIARNEEPDFGRGHGSEH